MSQAGRRATGWHPPSGFPRGGNTEGRGLHEHYDRSLKLRDCSPEVRRPFLPHLLTLARVLGRGPRRSQTGAGRGRGDEPEADVMSIFPKRLLWEPLEGMNEITDAWLIFKKKKKVEAAGCAILSAIFSVAHLAASSWALHGPDPF